MFGAWGEAFTAVGPAVLLYMAVAMIAGIYGSIALGGFNFTWEGAKPKGSKMSPIQGFKRMFVFNLLLGHLHFFVVLIHLIRHINERDRDHAAHQNKKRPLKHVECVKEVSRIKLHIKVERFIFKEQ